MILTYDLPENRGVMNGLKRARQFTEFAYTVVKPFPICCVLYPDGVKTYQPSLQFAGWPGRGLPYSSVIKHQKFIGYHVSIESFMTALQDPRSILYTKNLFHGERGNAAAWYGTVCSSLASYVWDLPIQHTCGNWAEMEDVACLGQPALESLKLLDALLNATHIAVITGIQRDTDGRVCRIEVSESTLPNCRVTWFTADQFIAYWYECPSSLYRVYRRPDHSSITYEPSQFVFIKADPERGVEGDPVLPAYEYNPVIVPDHGNRSNYLAGSESVTLDLLDPAYTTVEITDQAGRVRVYSAEDEKVCPGEQPCGRYTATALDEAGNRSASVEYAVVGYVEPVRRDVFTPGEPMDLRLASLVPGDKPLYYCFSQKSNCNTVVREVIPAAAAAEGWMTVSAPQEEGDYFLTLGTKNEYGIYSSDRYYFSIRARS